MSQRRVGVWRAMLGASRISHEKRQLTRTCNNFHKPLKIKEIKNSEHIGVLICSPTTHGSVNPRTIRRIY